MHISQRYLDLTKQKLELTRLPREPRFLQGHVEFGVSKSELEPLIDHWLERYDWKGEETAINDALPQFRLPVNGTRLHFVHKRSTLSRVTPLLFVHGWPDSFLSVSKVIDALCDPIMTPPHGDENAMSFHVVAPSSPGFGFSEALPEEGNNLQMTADMLDGLMKALGYKTYMVHGSGWGFKICRAMALRHPQSVIAIHTANPDVPPPRPGLAYNTDDVTLSALSMHSPQSPSFPTQGSYTPHGSPRRRMSTTERPQTLSFALADSPAGLLAFVYDLIRPPIPPSGHSMPTHSGQRNFGLSALQNPWTPTTLINWTMMHWLPGPEVALRWLTNSRAIVSTLWLSFSNVPIGISHFQDPTAGDTSPMGPIALTWTEAYHRVLMVRRREGRVRFPAWERPAELVVDIRELADVLTRARIDA
ncbi:hypothetical protein AMS68_007018 [Peltaster fructicola]|uniref:Epoxide hydrolase N-terminal domain-containing protein n=1 Tax=Peltaster fructicola TaxID=286661 RepID=A0A6H0Y3K9_9PEZI|nr:hypothetical protein AMS68_007018 [Peltaster fructicola]